MQRIVLLACLGLSACSVTVIQTRHQTVVCHKGKEVALNAPIDPTYQLVYTGTQYELRLMGSSRRVAVFDKCQIEILSSP